MSQQINAEAEILGVASSSTKIRLDEYKLQDSEVCTVYSRNRCWKRFSPVNSAGPAQWFEQGTSGRRPVVSKRRNKWLNRIWKRRDSYRHVHRFPRNDEKGERLLSDLANAYANGKTDVAITMLDQIRNHLGSLMTFKERDSAWNTLPRFDPTLVQRTNWLIHSFLAEGSIQLVFGEPGSFKSTFMLAAAKAVANREEFLGLKTRRRRVLVLDFENPPNIIKSRNDDLSLGLARNHNLRVWDRFGPQRTPRPDDLLLEELVKECVAETGHAPG